MNHAGLRDSYQLHHIFNHRYIIIITVSFEPDLYFGLQCEEPCNCPLGGLCHHVTGVCLCETLGDGSGAACSEPCDEGHYGNTCRMQCHCENGATCDRVTGECSCTPGQFEISVRFDITSDKI